MAEVRSNLRITVEGDGLLVATQKHYDDVAKNAAKAQAAAAKFAAAGTFERLQITVGAAASKVDMLSGGMSSLGGLVAKLSNPWMLAGVAVTGAVGAVVKFVDQGSKLADLSTKFRMSTDDLQRLGSAGAMANVSTESFAKGIFKLRKNLGETPEKFRELGINVEHWKSLGGAELALEFSRAMESVKNETQAAAVGTELAGKGYLSMAAALNSSEIEEAMQRQVALTAEQVAKADELGDKWERVKRLIAEKTSNTGSGIADYYASGVVKMAQKWDSYFGTNLSTPSEKELQAKIAQNAKTDPSMVKPDLGELYQRKQVEKEEAAKAKERARAYETKKARDERENAETLRIAESNDRAILKIQGDVHKEAMTFDKEQHDTFVRLAMEKANKVVEVKELEREVNKKTYEEQRKQMAEMKKANEEAYEEQRRQGRDPKSMMDAGQWAEYNAGFARAIDSAQRMAGLFGTLRAGLADLGFGADSFAMKLAQGIEMGAAAKAQLLESANKNDKWGMASAGLGGLMSAYKSGSFMGGAATGAMLGSSLGKFIPGGGIVGAIGGGIIGGIAGLFGKKKAPTEKQLADEKYGGSSTEDLFGQMASKTEYATQGFLKLMNAAKGSAQYTQWMNQNLDLAAGGVSKMVDAMQYLGADGAIATAGAFSASFFNTLKSKGLAAATETFAPMFEKVNAQFAEMGLDPSQFGMDKIARYMQLGQDPKTAALLAGIGGNSDYLKGTLNAGYMTSDTLSGSGKIAKSTYDELRNQGLDEKEAYEQMADYLSAVQRASEASGEKIPAEIEKMIADAKANGIEFTKQPLDKLVDYNKEIRDILLAKLGGSSSSSTSGAGSNPSTDNVHYNPETGETEGWGPRPAGYPPSQPWPPEGAANPNMATGGLVRARPGGTWKRLGEAGEDEYVTPASRMGGGGGGGNVLHFVLGGPSFTPLNTAESQRALAQFQITETVRQLTNSPLVRQAVQIQSTRWRR